MYVIYQILNKENNNRYIGSAKDFKRRKRTHLRLLRKGTHHSKHLQNAFNKYGEGSFEFLVLQELESSSYVFETENQFIRLLRPEYNVMQDVFSHIGLKRSKETCEKISRALIGKNLSEGHKEKVRQANIGKKQSAETIAKRVKGRYKPIGAYHFDDSLFRIFESATHAAKEMGYYRNSICRALNGNRKSYKNLKWKKL